MLKASIFVVFLLNLDTRVFIPPRAAYFWTTSTSKQTFPHTWVGLGSGYGQILLYSWLCPAVGTNIMVSNTSKTDLTRSGWIPDQTKVKKGAYVNHVPHIKLSQLYSTAKTSDQSSVSTCLDRERKSSLISPELDKERGAPWGCARRAWGSHF